MNIPFTKEQIANLPLGYHITRTPMGMHENMPVFYPNRKERNNFLKRLSGKNKKVQHVTMLIPEKDYKSKPRDIIIDKYEGFIKGSSEVILKVRRTILHDKL